LSRVAPNGRLLGVEFALPIQGAIPLSSGVGKESRAVQRRLVLARVRSWPHLDAIDRAGRQAQLATGAAIGQNRMHVFRGADDGVHRARREATRASDAARFIDPRHARRGVYPMRRIQCLNRPVQQRRERENGGGASWRTLIDLGLASRDCLGVGLAPIIAAACALSLRQQCIDSRHEVVRGLAIHII
jgi:hypothetical protein